MKACQRCHAEGMPGRALVTLDGYCLDCHAIVKVQRAQMRRNPQHAQAEADRQEQAAIAWWVGRRTGQA